MSELAEALKEKGYINLKIISGKRVAVISDDNRKDLLLKLACDILLYRLVVLRVTGFFLGKYLR